MRGDVQRAPGRVTTGCPLKLRSVEAQRVKATLGWAFAATLLVTYLVFANQTMLRERRKRAEGRGQRAESSGG